MKTVWKILSTLFITFIGAGITCGGNIFLATSSVLGDFIQKLNDALGFGSEPYTGPNILWMFWFIEIVVIFWLSIRFFFFRNERLNPEGRSKVSYIVDFLLILLIALPFIVYSVYFLAFINDN
ncbi:hypothetical protein KBC86_03390 [Candidatus Gracilibacteria bacterium]|nr:hypothetical protein [Candidatus Gracilibacteria bacterium]